ncbi:MAG: hypothetical protein MI924_28570 [Chloroflexales bacterium]|nr:hypothetical protein [Chloroflexales bacterium]
MPTSRRSFPRAGVQAAHFVCGAPPHGHDFGCRLHAAAPPHGAADTGAAAAPYAARRGGTTMHSDPPSLRRARPALRRWRR